MNQASPVIVMVGAEVDAVARLAADHGASATTFVVGDAELAETYANVAPEAEFVPGSSTALAVLASHLSDRRIDQLVLAAAPAAPARKSRLLRRQNREELASAAAESSLQTQAAAFERLAGHLAAGATVTFVLPAESSRYETIVAWARDCFAQLHSMFEGEPDPAHPHAIRVPGLRVVGLIPAELDAVASTWTDQIVSGSVTSGVVTATQVPGLGVPEVPATPAVDAGFADDAPADAADRTPDDAPAEALEPAWSFADEPVTAELPVVTDQSAEPADGEPADVGSADVALVASPDVPLAAQFSGAPLPPPAWPSNAAMLEAADREADLVRAEAAAFGARVRETALREADEMVGRALQEADSILSEAREAAETSRARAAATAEQVTAEARASADATMASARADAAEVAAESARVRSEADVYARDVEHRCDSLYAEATQLHADAAAARDAADADRAAAAADRVQAAELTERANALLAMISDRARAASAGLAAFIAELEAGVAGDQPDETADELAPVADPSPVAAELAADAPDGFDCGFSAGFDDD